MTLSQQWNVAMLAPQSSVTFSTTTQFGQQPPANEPPNAVADSIATDEDEAKGVDVLANDSDPDEDTVSVVNATDGAHGTVSCDGGLCTYTPDADFNGSDSFTYTITDGRGGNDTGTVEVTVEPVNDAPVLDNSGSPTLTSIAEDSGVSGGTTVAEILATGAGGDPITDVNGEPFEGIAVAGTDSSNGTWEYSSSGGEGWSPVGASNEEATLLPSAKPPLPPVRDFTGSATIEFRAWDQTSRARRGPVDTTENGGTTAFSTAKEQASIEVTAVNDAPVADGDAHSGAEDGSLEVAAPGVLDNDTDKDDECSTAVSRRTLHGELDLNLTAPSPTRRTKFQRKRLLYVPRERR